jgi:methionyl-tRNA formyltransferase
MNIGANLVIKTLKAIKNNEYTLSDQEELSSQLEIKHAPKIYKTDCKIDWIMDVEHIHNFIRGLSPYPAAYSELLINKDKTLQAKFYKTHYLKCEHENRIGTIETDNKKTLSIWAKNGKIIVDEIQISGKKRLSATDFLNGFKFGNDYFAL